MRIKAKGQTFEKVGASCIFYRPEVTDIDRSNKAPFAFPMLTGARGGAVASVGL